MKIALLQICSVLDYQENLQKIESFLKNCSKDIEAVFLPEVFYSLSHDGPTPFYLEKSNEHYKNVQNLAQKYNVALIGGSAATKKEDKRVNRAYVFDKEGNELCFYDKIHLFKLESLGLDESKSYSPGEKLVDYKLDDKWHLGLSVCFDLRFSELYRSYFEKGVNLLTVASAFTETTGKAHWETLLRARAIETQSYIVASNQCGENAKGKWTYGHSMVVDPWGKVIAKLDDKEGVVECELDYDYLVKVRSRLNVSKVLK